MDDAAEKTVAIGMITPSSNTVLEPMTYDMLADLPRVTAHFTRLKVTEISTQITALNQFERRPLLEAADLLADAKVSAIAWNGTSSSWLGFDRDTALASDIEAMTGVPGTSSVIAINAALEAFGAMRIAIVTPYLGAIQKRIIANYETNGYAVIAERHLEDPGNYSFALHSEAQIASLIREVAAARPDAVAIVCTNFRGTRIAAELEKEFRFPIVDSIAATLWHTLCIAGVPCSGIVGWSRIFACPAPAR